jgi:3-oxoacyl-[acyl-carrier protein] reductase
MGFLDGKVAIVTGAGRGLGREYAHRLASLGAKVVVTDINLKSFEAFQGEKDLMTASSTVDEIIASGGEAFGIEFDVGDYDAAYAMADQVIEKWGKIDVLVANAGGGSGTPQETAASILTPEHLEVVVRRNVFGTVYTCGAVARYMKEQNSGKIVTVTSKAGLVPAANYAHYGTSKAAVIHYTKALAFDLAPFHINVNCLAPGLVLTGRVSQFIDNATGGKGMLPPLGVQVTTEDLANGMEFLVSPASDSITGQILSVDGG